MVADGADVHATDPEAISRAMAIYPEVSYHRDLYDALRDAEAALICTEWEAFRQLDWERPGKLMARRLVIDERNLLSHKRMRALGFEYFVRTGRGKSRFIVSPCVAEVVVEQDGRE
jgi:UDPglucose 6-dehydrogenase